VDERALAAIHSALKSRWPTSILRAGWLEAALLLSLTLTLNLAGNARTGLWDRDEPKYAACVREMRERGNWLTPTYNGEPRHQKPVLIYWLMGVSTAIAGDNPFGVRLVSALAGAGSVLGVWVLGRRMLCAQAGRIAAIIMATAPIAIAESKLATTDATLALLLLGCQACLWVLGRRDSSPVARAFWLLLALAMLTKGPVGPAIIAISSIFAWWWGWPPDALKRLRWRWGLTCFSVLTVPWFLYITIASHGEFLSVAIGGQIIERITTDMESHGGIPGYYPIVSSLVFYPWSTLVPVAVAGGWLRRRTNPNLAFLLGWALGPLVLLECFRTKLIHYYLPALPALALLVAWLAIAISADEVNIRRWPLGRLALALLVGIGLSLSVVLIALAVIAPANLCLPLVCVATAISAGTLAGLHAFQQGATLRAIHILGGTWAVVMLLISGWLIPLGEPLRTSKIVGERLAAISAETGYEPILLHYKEPGVIYSMGRPIETWHDAQSFYEHFRGGRSMITVIDSDEIEVIRKKYGFTMTPIEEFDAYVLSKGTRPRLMIAIMSKNDQPPASSTGIAARPEQSLVK
jgi:4-amino-4-deoxy-L-arabinose transferase-like glycosyltransferase